MRKLFLIGIFVFTLLVLSSCLLLPDGSILMYDPWDDRIEYYPSHVSVHYDGYYVYHEHHDSHHEPHHEPPHGPRY